VNSEREALLGFLGQQRLGIRTSVRGLTDEQAAATPAASALSLSGILKHIARTERRWVVVNIAGRPLPGLWPIEDWAADFRAGPGESLASLLKFYAETARLTEEIVAGVGDLGQPCANPDSSESVHWVLFHLIEETARHAGHADIIREALDGARAGPLLRDAEAAAQPG
jgi:hypothetical protein